MDDDLTLRWPGRRGSRLGVPWRAWIKAPLEDWQLLTPRRYRWRLPLYALSIAYSADCARG